MKVEHAKRLDEQDHRSLVLWAADCAEHVLPYFEEKYSEDNRPRKALDAARAWVRGEIAMSEARAAASAAHAAARAAATEGDWQHRCLPKRLSGHPLPVNRK